MDIETYHKLKNEDCITVFVANHVRFEIERRANEDYHTTIDTNKKETLQEILNISEGIDLDHNIYYQIDEIVDDFLFNIFE